MLRAIVILLTGAAVGAGSTLLLRAQHDSFAVGSGDSPSLLRAVADRALGRASRQPAVVSVADQVEAYAAAAELNDPASLHRALERAAASARSPARDLELDALLVRLSGIDPAGAVDLAIELGLDPPFIIAGFVLWAEQDVEMALAALGSIGDPVLRRGVALALLDVTGADAAGAKRVADALTAAERDAFRVDWLAMRAESEPLAAFRDAGILPDAITRDQALQAVVAEWVRQDPASALRQIDALTDQVLRRQLRMLAYYEWATAQPDTFVAYIESGIAIQDEMMSGLALVSSGDPDLALRIAQNIPGERGQSLYSNAVIQLAAIDPMNARARAESLPPGQFRDGTIASVASILAITDADAALQWISGLSPPVPDATNAVMLQLAETDPVRAFELLESHALVSDSQLILSSLASRAARAPDKARELADFLAGRDDIQSSGTLERLISTWAQVDSQMALDWALANEAQLDTSILASAAGALANQNLPAAIDYIDRIPTRHRTMWITEVAGAYGRTEPAAALRWVSQFQGQAVHDIALREIINGAAETDPQVAAQALSQASPQLQAGLANIVASRWSQQDPRAAAEWANTLSDRPMRSSAVSTAIGIWSNYDNASAKRWTLGLRADESRDQILTTLMSRSANNGEFDSDLLDEFSAETSRQQALQSTITTLARRDPDLARDILDREVTNPAQRQAIARQIESQREFESQQLLRPSGSLVLFR